VIEDPVEVVIGGKTWRCPPMPFYCLERAWPHIGKLARMNTLTQTLARAELRVRQAETVDQHDEASQALAATMQLIDAEGAGFVGHVREALHIIVAALSLDPEKPTYEQLAQVMTGAEMYGVERACAQLIELSGLGANAPGEDQAMMQPMPVQLNGAASSLN
jgi:hypothetical protein